MHGTDRSETDRFGSTPNRSNMFQLNLFRLKDRFRACIPGVFARIYLGPMVPNTMTVFVWGEPTGACAQVVMTEWRRIIEKAGIIT